MKAYTFATSVFPHCQSNTVIYCITHVQGLIQEGTKKVHHVFQRDFENDLSFLKLLPGLFKSPDINSDLIKLVSINS